MRKSGVSSNKRIRPGRILLFVSLGFSTCPGFSAGLVPRQDPSQAEIPSGPLEFGDFSLLFAKDGGFTLEGEDWPSFKGSWKHQGSQLELLAPSESEGCKGPARYRYSVENGRLKLDLISDDCPMRRMVLDGSSWRPAGTEDPLPVRSIVRTGSDPKRELPPPRKTPVTWPSFRGVRASGISEGLDLPERWDGNTGENVLWKVPIPGLSHSSPIVWGDRLYVTTAISSRGAATFRPGLYGDGDASDDRSSHRWVVYAIDRGTGEKIWERTAYEGEPVDKRHIKSTYASSTAATDGRVVVAWFGSQGVYAYTTDGDLLWKVDLGRMDLGAYNVPTVEWGPASSPIIWNDLVILQCDTQADSFILALRLETGETVWKTDRDELPSWGTPTVAETPQGPELVTNASNFIRGYDPRSGKELWRLGGSSKITAPTPLYENGVFVVASGRGPERPIFVVRAGARGDLTLPKGETRSESVAWSRTGRGSYMPTPLIYREILYVLANNGIFDAYELATGEEIYRQRLPKVGSGFSASPVGADGNIYLSSEDGDILVVRAGPTFELKATNPIGELLMATPALADGVMYVRSSESLFAIGRRK